MQNILSMKNFYHLLIALLVFNSTALTISVNAQVLNPADPIVIYNPKAPPAVPPYGQIQKWVITRDITSWNTDAYKAYIYNGMQFRLLYPRSYKPGVSDGKTYPMIIMFHGAGELGTVYDNDLSLVHGGQNELNAENSGVIDAFVLHAQNGTGYWGPSQYVPISNLISIMSSTVKLDPLRISVHGLSAGGIACWDVLNNYPKLIANAAPMSAADQGFITNLSQFKYSPLWYSQGGLDNSPSPSSGNNMVAAIRASGANLNYLYYPTLGHNTWDNTYANPGFYPFFMTANKTNPLVFFQKSGFCPGSTVSAKLGVTAGFDGYQWRKNKVIIPTATSNELMVTDTGSYDVSIKNGGAWSYFSPIPAHIYIQPILPAPAIVMSRLESNVYPVLDSSKKVSLTIPGNFMHYAWSVAGSSTIIDTNKIFKATAAGNYVVSVTLNNGCSSLNSPIYAVGSAPGTNMPPPASNVLGFAPNYTSIKLIWSQIAAPAYNETGFEVYRSKISGGPYAFAGITPADTASFTDTGLQPNTKYFYILRAVNLTGASVATQEISAITQVDNIAPTSPPNLQVTAATSSALSVSWQKATDNVAVYQYYIYVNGVKSYVVDSSTTSFTINSLTPLKVYTVFVKASDVSGNVSPASNQVTAYSIDKGLLYNYYTFANTPSVLPNYNALTPVKTGYVHNTDISISTQVNNFGYLWMGTLYIPVSGNYTLGTSSDDGSKLFLDMPYDPSATPTINNDGSHGMVNVEATKYLTAGPHKFSIAYFQGGGGSGMQFYWKNTPIPGITNQTTIADSFFVNKAIVPNLIPVAPLSLSALTVSYKQINLSWVLPNDTTHSLTGFELVRSSSAGGPYITIASLSASTSKFADSVGLSAASNYYYQIRSVGTSGQSAYAPFTGLTQQYYTSSINYPSNNLPDFNTLVPVSTQTINNITLAGITQQVNFAYKWTGTINIPTTGSYTFGTISDDGSKLYIDQPYSFAGASLINNDGPHGANAAEGTLNLTKGKHTFIATYQQLGGGYTMSVYCKKMVNGVLTNVPLPDSSFVGSLLAKTSALPPLATAPGTVSLKSISGSKLQLSFTDTSTVASSFQIYRSATNGSSYNLIANINAVKIQSYIFLDTGLVAGGTYYYKIRAVNITGPGVFSTPVSASTIILAPTIGQIATITVQPGTTKLVQVSSNDPQNLKLVLTTVNLPAYAQFKDYGDGTGLLTLKPVSANLGVYKSAIVTASNGKLSSSDTLTIVVNTLYPPVLDSLVNKNITSFDSISVGLHSTDQSASKVKYTTSVLPGFIKLLQTGAFTGTLTIHPGLNDAGTYQIAVSATDSLGSFATRNFTLVVNPFVKTQNISINFNGAANSNALPPFNNTTASPAINQNYPNLVNGAGKVTSIGFKVISDWASIVNQGHGSPGADYGPTTNNNSGVFPDLVEQSCWWTTIPQVIQFYGLQTNHSYDFTLYGGTQFSGTNFICTYQIGNQVANLDATNNTANTTAIKAQLADSSGHLSLTVSNIHGGFAYLNAIVLTDNIQVSGSPVAPTSLTATATQTGLRLNWIDNAVNETGYQVFRKLSTDSLYAQLNAIIPANGVVYLDSTVQLRKTYNYKVRAVNNTFSSSFTNVATFTVMAKAPQLKIILPVVLKTDSVFSLAIYAIDDSLSLTQLHFTATGVPANAVFIDNGNGKATITFQPRTADIGIYSITVTATDINNLSASRTFTLSVQDKNIVSTFINFNQTASDASPAPWNNTNSLPNAGLTLTNLIDQYGNNSGINMSLVNSFTGLNDYGVQTGNNSGVFPDAVLKAFYYTSISDTMRIQFTGLSPNKKYNIDMMGSWSNPYGTCVTNYTVGTSTITIDPTNNSTKLASFRGLTSDSYGKLQVKVSKVASSTYGLINAMVLSSFTDNGVPLSPVNLSAVAASSKSIVLNWVDRAYNETGFYILRSTSATGPFAIVDSVLQGVTTYTNTGLVMNTSFYFEVVARGKTLNSAPSNIANASTLIYFVRVNFNLNATDAAPAPWNNTNSLPSAKIALPLNNEFGSPTGVVLSFARSFTDYNSLGAQTGNDSGVFPDAVLRGFYYTVFPDSAVVLLSNLNLNLTYDISTIASYGNHSWGSTVYKIGNTQITLNPLQNTSNLATFTNIIPDANGQIRIIVKIAPGASFIFINGLTLQAHSYSAAAKNLLATSELFKSAAGIIPESKSFSVFPNPFVDKVSIKLFAKTAGTYRVGIYDYSGRLVYVENAQQITALVSTVHEISLTSSGLVKGMYILRVISNVMPDQTLKIMKL